VKERHILDLEADPDQLHDWLLQLGLTPILDQTRTHVHPRMLRWRSARATVTWVEDHTLGVRCLEIVGRLPEPPVPTLSTARLLESSGRDPDARRALQYLSATELDFWRSPREVD
jgi:hypothetical protein